LDTQVHPDKRGSKVQKARVDSRAQSENQGRSELLVRLEHPGMLDLLETKDPLVSLVNLVKRVQEGRMASKDSLELLEIRALPAHKVCYRPHLIISFFGVFLLLI